MKGNGSINQNHGGGAGALKYSPPWMYKNYLNHSSRSVHLYFVWWISKKEIKYITSLICISLHFFPHRTSRNIIFMRPRLQEMLIDCCLAMNKCLGAHPQRYEYHLRSPRDCGCIVYTLITTYNKTGIFYFSKILHLSEYRNQLC